MSEKAPPNPLSLPLAQCGKDLAKCQEKKREYEEYIGKQYKTINECRRRSDMFRERAEKAEKELEEAQADLRARDSRIKQLEDSSRRCLAALKKCEELLAAKQHRIEEMQQEIDRRLEKERELYKEIDALKAANKKLKEAAGPAAFHKFKARQAARAGRAGVRGGGGLYNNHDCAAEIAAAVAAAGTTFPTKLFDITVNDTPAYHVLVAAASAAAATAYLAGLPGGNALSFLANAGWLYDATEGGWLDLPLF